MTSDGRATTLRTYRDAGTLWLTLDGERVRNAVDDDVYRAMAHELQQAERDSTIRAVALTGSGTAFCAGMNLNAMVSTSADPVTARQQVLLGARVLQQLRDLVKPTVAVVNGVAAGAGLGLVAACDVAVAVESAVFAVPEVRVGLIAGVVAPLLIEAVGYRTAKRLLLVGDRIDAETALRFGLVHAIATDRTDAVRVAEDYLAQLHLGGPRALAETKRFLAATRGAVMSEADLPSIASRVVDVRSSPEAIAAMQARLAKQPIQWELVRQES